MDNARRVLFGPVPALDLLLGLRVVRTATRMPQPPFLQLSTKLTRDVRWTVVAEKPHRLKAEPDDGRNGCHRNARSGSHHHGCRSGEGEAPPRIGISSFVFRTTHSRHSDKEDLPRHIRPSRGNLSGDYGVPVRAPVEQGTDGNFSPTNAGPPCRPSLRAPRLDPDAPPSKIGILTLPQPQSSRHLLSGGFRHPKGRRASADQHRELRPSRPRPNFAQQKVHNAISAFA